MFARNRQKTIRQPSEIETPLSLSAAQRVVAQRMQESKQTIPHFYLQTSANAEPMITRRNAASGEKPGWDAFFMYAAGKVLKQYERMCVSFSEGQLIRQPVEAVGVAVDLEGDLYVIRVASPALKTPEQISVEIEALVQRLRDGDAEVRQTLPSNLTISNLGSAGVESYIAIVNPPKLQSWRWVKWRHRWSLVMGRQLSKIASR
jgi:pyruvate dehydrogenase E2 component (dihydrolipoamide acetyltransferase)